MMKYMADDINNGNPLKIPDQSSEILLYQTEDGRTKLEVRFSGETVWLTLNQLADLFQRDKSVISKHIRNIFDEGELRPDSTVANYATVQKEGGRAVSRNIEYYNLDVIISVGYRVSSHSGTQFRIWATQRLREYIVKGFTLDDERLKRLGGGNYFDELLARIRDIRSSEKVFWRKVLDIYAISIDYDPNNDLSREFFATVQNKMHWAAHSHTAAEIIANRADASKPYMGLTSWTGSRPLKADAGIAKNYLNQEEIDALNRIVSIYLDFAELQAKSRKPMSMKDWIKKLDDFLRLSERDILTHAGVISHEEALAKANAEYEIYHALELEKPLSVENHFQEAVEQVKRLEQKTDGKQKPKSLPRPAIKDKKKGGRRKKR
jgi:hypothetical protein